MIYIPFVKMHGLGNDFVIINKTDISDNIDVRNLVKTMSDRRIGVGCDQFIIYEYNENEDINMFIYNQDGSSALACGNASRCLSALIYGEYKKKEITLNINGRKVICEYHGAANIKVNMGKVSFDKQWMPSTEKLWSVASAYNINPKEILCADVANPHLVIFSKLSEKDQEIIGKNMQSNGLFANGVNVNFARIDGNKIHLKVWERGAGFTLACGSGAIASFASACKLGKVSAAAIVEFKLGQLAMQKSAEDFIMTGPATQIFKGNFCYE